MNNGIKTISTSGLHFLVTPKAEITCRTEKNWFELRYEKKENYTPFLTYELYYHQDEDTYIIGSVRIKYLIEDSYNYLPEKFKTIPDNFETLGNDLAYYKNMEALFEKDGTYLILHALNDIAINNALVDEFFKKSEQSLSLYLDSLKIIRLAKSIIEGRKEQDIYSFNYHFNPIYNPNISSSWKVDIDFESDPIKRTYAIIGENGVGKTQLLSNFKNDYNQKKSGQFVGELPLFSRILTLCTSDYYHYDEKETYYLIHDNDTLVSN